MKTSTERILTTHVGSIPRPESIRTLLRARVGGQPIDEAELAARAAEAVTEVVRRQAEVGLDVVSDGEMSKTSFLAYTDNRLSRNTCRARCRWPRRPRSARAPSPTRARR
jgi:5-methyltetrahydropteroyltriglutamate--homocysteine methyltransferase